MKIILLIIILTLTNLVNAFTYQGEISQTGTLFSGAADIKFSLYDADANGNQVGATDIHSLVTISNGRFAVDLDQWIGLYDGTPLWLEIEVDLNTTGSFTTLTPRQKLEPAPYAEFAYDGAGGNGDITGVTAGTGLTGGGNSGTVTLNVDPTVFQRRISGICGEGYFMYRVDEDGDAYCRAESSFDISTVWSTTGNSGTDQATNFIGTTDNQEFVVKVGNKTVMRFIPKSGASTPNVISGSSGNSITGFAHGAVVAGGGSTAESTCGSAANESCINTTSAPFGTVSGGYGNQVHEVGSVISGGYRNIIGDSAFKSVIVGGELNTIENSFSTISGGNNNTILGQFSSISGGLSNYIGGDHSWAGGASAKVQDGNDGSFVWDGDADSAKHFNSTDSGQFLVRAPGGMWLGNGLGNLFPDIQNSALLINSEFTKIPLTIRHDTSNIFRVQTNGGTSIGSDSAAANNGLRVAGETNLMDVVGVGTTTPNSTFHVNSPLDDTAMRVQINGTTRFKVDPNGAVGIGNNFGGATLPASGLKVQGNTEIVGSLSKGGGSFKIDHPLDPENKYLYHSFVESPDMMNIYNGNVITDKNGEAWVEMPDWFEALNMEFRYQLTVIGVFAHAIVGEKINNSKFMVRTNQPNVEVSWQVTGIRKDVWAEKNRIPVEEEKSDLDKGKYLHPKAWNIDQKRAIGFEEEES